MEMIETRIKDLYEIRPRVFEDPRGYFFESYNKKVFEGLGIQAEFVQDNQSLSGKGVLRGLHLQAPPFEQGKLVRVIKGSVLDVAVDIRKGSPTFGQHVAIELSEENKKMFWIPPGFAHGFLTLADETIFAYKCTGYYDRNSEMAVRWNDPELGIDWGIKDPILSEKDEMAPLLKDFQSPFTL
ncbi:MAG: dTDP-4-dehydrorhamnose 3,5-epimerase [Bacteroidota bacterium]|nr:dTDP-4-dehydrorhamnose 3,5-epimerase [Bacteroidota bacterium]MDX5426845.1 dTDP-4-dehydrorhamnose 3,5-epimerase [Bacteroidota bacterium]MDX5504831.1 dTDP-4-dehydrorhamnose 3,5-epimerase [Bacteroidota bacterium]